MCNPYLRTILFWIMAAGIARPQVLLNPIMSRVIGHPSAEYVAVTSTNANFSAPGGMYSPEGVAVDTSGGTPILYVADSLNNRILVWKNATSKRLTNLQAPDRIIGQDYPGQPGHGNPNSTLAGVNGGLHTPTGLLVDAKGNLYVADSGNHRILRYPTPLATSLNPLPDLVLGQPDPFTSNQQNQGLGAPTAKTLSLRGDLPTALAMNSSGTLFVTDNGNNRVLGFTADLLTPNNFDPAANIVLGQTDFTSTSSPQGSLDRNHIVSPSGLAFDSSGNLFVADAQYNRVMVFPGPIGGGTVNLTATRLAGIISNGPFGTSASSFSEPEGIVMINDGPAVMDTRDNRILVFDPFSSTDWQTSDSMRANPPPVAIAQLGQPNYTSGSPNAGDLQPAAGTLANPVAAAIAGSDLFVADSMNNRVLVFPNAPQGAAAAVVLGQSNFPYNSINSIRGREFSFGPNYFCYYGSQQTYTPFSLECTSNGGQQIGPLRDAGVAIDQVSDPSTPHLYVSDPGNHRVLGFKDARKLGPGALSQADLVIGQSDFSTALCNSPVFPGGGMPVQNPPPGQLDNQPSAATLCYPTGLAVDSSGNLYVADTLNGRVLRFPKPFASGMTNSEPADLVLGQSSFTGLRNPTVNQFFMGLPYGLAWDPANGLVVSDLKYNRVLLFAKDNLTNGAGALKVIGQLNFTASSPSTLNQPNHVAVDSQSRVYVADIGDGRIAIFGSLSQLGTATTTTVNTLYNYVNNSPQALWVNPSSVASYKDDIWAGDSSNGVVRYPSFDSLIPGNNNPLVRYPSVTDQPGAISCDTGGQPGCLGVLAITQDKLGDLYVADYSNRVTVHYPAVAVRNGANFVCAAGCDILGENPASPYVAPGTIAVAAPFNTSIPFSTQIQRFTDLPNPIPVPTELAGAQVLVNEVLSPLFFVSPNQINFVVPSSAPTSGTVEVQVYQPSTGQILGSYSLYMNTASPALFTSNQQGSGQIAVINTQDGTVNGPDHPAARGSVISLYGTGQGLVPGAPPDGQLAEGLLPTPTKPRVFIGAVFVDDSAVQYSGLAPGLVGVWQINVQIPQSTAPGNQVPLLVQYESIYSIVQGATPTWIAVK
jgi:uncharacterized protein (TIGR03437 family)